MIVLAGIDSARAQRRYRRRSSLLAETRGQRLGR
jgi:hypothetical protein